MIQIQKSGHTHQIGQGQISHECFKTKDKVILNYSGDIYELSISNNEKEIVSFNKYNIEEYKVQKQAVVEQIKFNQVYGITKLAVKTYLIVATKCQVVGLITSASLNMPIFKVNQIKLIQIGTTDTSDPLQPALLDSFKLLNLYYSKYDLSQRIQYAYSKPDYYQHCFISNYDYTIAYDNYPNKLMRKFIFGYANVKEVQRDNVKYRLAVVSRGSSRGMGRRWHRRGITEQKYVATNFETEIILEISSNETSNIYSFVQQRGSIPILWAQNPNFDKTAPFVVSHNQQEIKEQMKRYLQKQEKIQKKYKLICLINKTGNQGKLGDIFEDYFKSLHRQNSQLLWYDYHNEYLAHKGESFNRLIEIIRQDIKQFGYFTLKDVYGSQEICKKQEGIFRINCIDCLDRSNHVQSLIAKVYLLNFIDHFHQRQQNINFPLETVEDSQLEKHFKSLWGQNARAISTQCSGTPAMKMDLYSTGTGNFAGRIRDFGVGTKRYYLGHFVDYYYQNCYDLHFKKLENNDRKLRVYGCPLKPLAFVASFAAIGGLSYGAYKYIESKVEDKIAKPIASAVGSFITTWIGLKIIKANSDLFVRRAIIRSDFV